MNPEHIALVALLRTRPDGLSWPKLTEKVLEAGSATAVWDHFDPEQLIPSPVATAALADAAGDLAAWEQDGVNFISVLDTDYPQQLLDIVETPPFLFAQGQVVSDDQGMSVVGARKASERGKDIAAKIADFLVSQGLTVIAGLAAGIDAAAHSAALAAGGRTVAFIGTGSTVFYPPQNRDLQAAIAAKGLVLSQFWPDATPQKYSFPMRNALMSGYGLATIVVEAGETSGTRGQARAAVAHGRPVILTGSVVDGNEWARALLPSPGVHRIDSLTDLAAVVDEIRAEPQRTSDALSHFAFR